MICHKKFNGILCPSLAHSNGFLLHYPYYISKPLANRRTLLIVLDGLDEAADWQAGADFMPAELPARVRVIGFSCWASVSLLFLIYFEVFGSE